jgi:hypothetical protein
MGPPKALGSGTRSEPSLPERRAAGLSRGGADAHPLGGGGRDHYLRFLARDAGRLLAADVLSSQNGMRSLWSTMPKQVGIDKTNCQT